MCDILAKITRRVKIIPLGQPVGPRSLKQELEGKALSCPRGLLPSRSLRCQPMATLKDELPSVKFGLVFLLNFAKSDAGISFGLSARD